MQKSLPLPCPISSRPPGSQNLHSNLTPAMRRAALESDITGAYFKRPNRVGVGCGDAKNGSTPILCGRKPPAEGLGRGISQGLGAGSAWVLDRNEALWWSSGLPLL
jgi:hypothetical protein